MKLGHALFILFVVVVALGLWGNLFVKEQKPIEVIKPDSTLLVLMQELKAQNDSLKSQTQIRDTVIHEKIKIVYKNANSVYGLGADTSLQLFAKWTRELQDSNYRAGYIRLGSGSSNQ